ncbi:AraC family transcriptional regulator [Streptomyces albireticuli]|uniref:AraC family transcriptional regulator n=1 Tax=Streptomyces albireticuli TaxID=1940 RepID=A0A2A2DBI3_9ACTN|nr:AraC family transcriptional regulator [Streptomyces albireticuli]MCD9145082.1 AraC family transcriptional regulator [Streptomyces albireticuli]MCD9164508.1 AraC family transcriptional regulator [Streptomyces albireticuli]MCD9194219.1 AraC family transcriptional regulator [Streptomyces albireticuli]PAU48884.1 AraC family transcriptional regulator [Streptomyces albireticuli]
MDILTEALASMRTGSPTSVRTEGRAPWGLRLPPVAGAGFHVVLYGTCWLIPLEDAPGGGPSRPEPIALSPGDVIFLRDGRGHILADHPSTPAEEERPEQFRPGSPIGTVTLGGDGPRTSLLCGNYHLDQGRPHPLVRQLPAVIHLETRHGHHPELSAAVQLLGAELENPRIGTDGIVPTLIDSLLLYILRAWFEAQPAAAAEGWAAALGDPAVAPALAAVHDDPSAPWTVEALAERAGLSRAAFARRFTALVGEPPMAYLTRWRMTTAAELLRESDAPLTVVAARTGYSSEFAFAKAFKRAYGLAPGVYRRQPRAA